MSTIYDRNRKPTDAWTKREQLCLASAVLKSGDQNWLSVSRTLKQLCSNEGRPQDWYSHKNCAVQYGFMLENVEATKRKKRTNENVSNMTVEPPTELLVKKLTEERSMELKEQIRKEQEEYLKLYNEIKAIEANQLSEEQLVAMLQTLKKEESNKVLEAKQGQEDRDNVQESFSSQKNQSDTTTVDMDVEEIVIPRKPTVTIPAQPTGTSPLLSSLLKSPTTTAPPQLPVVGSIARATAPTITTLLTSGSIPKTNQPAITLKSHIPPEEAVQMLTRPMTGPPVEGATTGNGASKSLVSPSQSAPTLSMLLEKAKTQTTLPTLPTAGSDIKCAEVKNETTETDDTNQNLVGLMELDEPMDSMKHELSNNDLDDPDQNEEQQLLEVFKNIGNIEELDIDVAAVIDDEEVDFLKDVEDVLASEAKQEDENEMLLKAEDHSKLENLEVLTSDVMNFHNKSKLQQHAEVKHIETIKAESSTSDDSNDNLPLSTVASMEREQSGDREKEKIEKKDEKSEIECHIKIKDEFEDNQKEPVKTDDELKKEIHNEKENSVVCKSRVESDTGDVIFVQTDEDDEDFTSKNDISTCQTLTQETKDTNNEDQKSSENQNELTVVKTKDETEELEMENKEILKDVVDLLDPTISIEETDEESCTGEQSTNEQKDDKPSGNDDSTIIEEDNACATESYAENTTKTADDGEQTHNDINLQETLNSSTTPARPPVLRKLRERDRSESPLVEDDTTTTSDHSTSNNQRSRRRYSSTPNIDSIPSSPVNSLTSSEHEERRETRGASKKSLLNAYNALQPSKHLSTFQRIFADAQRYHEVCFHPIDLPTIKRNIESGAIRTVSELQRDVMLMCTNALMLSKFNSNNYKHALALMHEVQTLREFAAQQHGEYKDVKPQATGSTGSIYTNSGSKGRGGSRKSQRNT